MYKAGPEPSSTSLRFSVRGAKAVVIPREYAGSSDTSLLAYAIIQNSHKLGLKVWPESSSTYSCSLACDNYQTLLN